MFCSDDNVFIILYKYKAIIIRLVVPGCDEIIDYTVRQNNNKNIINYYTN